MAYCPTHLALLPNADKRSPHGTTSAPASPSRIRTHIGSMLLPADAPNHPWLSKTRKIAFEEDTIEVFELATATTIRKVNPGEVKEFTIVPRKKKLVGQILERVKSLSNPKPLPCLPTRRRSATLPMRKSFSLPSILSTTTEGWTLPIEAKVSTMDAIQQIDKFFSQLAVLEDSPQRQSMTGSFQRAKAALMKRLSIESFGEYLDLEETIQKEMEAAKKAQTELLVLRHLEIEDGEDVNEDGSEVESLSSEIRRGLTDVGGFF